MTPEQAALTTVGAILAGGLARRLGGGDKGLRMIGDRTVLSRLVDRLTPQVARLVLNANDDPQRFQGLGVPVVADSLSDRPGPLAGVVTALEWAALSAPEIAWVVTVPGDAPFIPRDLVRRLHATRTATARSWPAPALGDGPTRSSRCGPCRSAMRCVTPWPRTASAKLPSSCKAYSCSIVEWEADPVDPFFNVNTPADLIEADHLVAVCPGL